MKSRINKKASKNNKRAKKAQLKIQETSFMLLALVLFFILAALFFLAIQYRQIHKSAQALTEEKSIATLAILAEMPEITCGSLCLDSDKLLTLTSNENRQRYKDLWPVSSIEIRKIFPRNDKQCTYNNYPACGVFNIIDKNVENEKTVSSFASLCRKESIQHFVIDKCEIAKIIVGIEIK